MPSKMITVALVASVLVASGGAPALARDGSYGPSGSFVADPDEAAFNLDQAGFRCPKAVALPKPPAPAVALKNAQTALTALAGKKALAAFGKSKAYKSADAIPAGVYTAMMTGRPSAALAASLRGAALEPTQPRHLINAAVILIGYGDLKQANGLLAAAAKVKGAGAALSLTAAQELDAARAELDVATGHFTLAEQIYRKLTRTDPALLFAQQGLAQTLECEHKPLLAAAHLARGQREMFDFVGEGDAGGDAMPPEIDAGSVDESAGKDIASFGSYYRPANQDDATAHLAGLQVDDAAAEARVQATSNFSDLGTDAGDRYFLYAGLVLLNDKELKRLLVEQGQIETDRLALRPAGGDAGSPPCYYSQHHAAAWDLVDRTYANSMAFAHRFHVLATALAAGVKDPVINRDLNVDAQNFVASMYRSVLDAAVLLSRSEADENIDPECRASGPTATGTGADTPEQPGADADSCSAAKAERLKVKVGSTVSAEFNCEQGKIEIVPVKYGIDQAYIGAFGEAGVKWKSGDVTMVSGVKVSVGTPGIPGLPSATLSGKAGFYVTAGHDKTQLLKTYGETAQHWTVKDWGVRLQGTAEVAGPKAGVVTTITKFDSKTDISLVGVFD